MTLKLFEQQAVTCICSSSIKIPVLASAQCPSHIWSDNYPWILSVNMASSPCYSEVFFPEIQDNHPRYTSHKWNSNAKFPLAATFKSYMKQQSSSNRCWINTAEFLSKISIWNKIEPRNNGLVLYPQSFAWRVTLPIYTSLLVWIRLHFCRGK